MKTPRAPKDTTAKKPMIPLKDVMRAIDLQDKGFYNRLNDEQKKAFSAWMIMRYASSVQGPNALDYIYLVNELVNVDFSVVSSHPELQWLLLSAAGSGKVEFHPYIKPPTAKQKKNKVAEFVQTVYPTMKGDEIDLLIEVNRIEDLRDLASQYGYSEKEIDGIFGKA